MLACLILDSNPKHHLVITLAVTTITLFQHCYNIVKFFGTRKHTMEPFKLMFLSIKSQIVVGE
jgi:hypothetical protein